MTIESEISKTVDRLKNGEVILYPTDTIWGIGCDATNVEAVDKVYSIKERPERKSLIVLVDSIEMLREYVVDIPPSAFELIGSYELPVTIIYPVVKHIAENVIAQDGSVGIRVATDDFCKEMIRSFGRPVVSTSANISGEAAPLTFRSISDKIKKKVDYIVDLKQNTIIRTKPSTIVRISRSGEFEIIRN